MNTNELRNRKPNKTNGDITTATTNSDHVEVEPTTKQKRVAVAKERWLLLPQTAARRVLWTLRLVAVCAFVAGTILRTKYLHNGDECSMTYSVRAFLPIETKKTTENAAIGESYNLYKFMDRRDPRYWGLAKKQHQHTNGKLSRTDHCHKRHDRHVVVYVPGHWGTYDQARSLGAHGFGLTEARESREEVRAAQERILAANDTLFHSEEKEDFVYSVYALDFGEQGGALHGRFLDSQSDFLASVVEQLMEDCSHIPRVTLVAHSMGGIVSRKLLRERKDLPIQQLITLATPHDNPLYAFDKSIADFYRQWLSPPLQHDDEDQNQPMVFSYVGGLRDEMIHPEACKVTDDIQSPNAWNTLARSKHSRIPNPLESKKPNIHNANLGMDHRAIVWCSQVLQIVRKHLWATLVLSRDHRSTLGLFTTYRFENHYFLEYDLKQGGFYRKLKFLYGLPVSICMTASMVYNFPYLLALYVVLAAYKCVGCAIPVRTNGNNRILSEFLSLITTIGLGYALRGEFWITLILVLVADSLNAVLVHLLVTCVGTRTNRIGALLRPPGMVLGKAMLQILLAVTVLSGGGLSAILLFGSESLSSTLFKYDPWGFFDSILYVSFIVSIYVLPVVGMRYFHKNETITSTTRFDVQLIALIMLAVPFLTAGTVTLMVWERRTQLSSWWTLLSMQVPVGIWTWAKMGKNNLRHQTTTTKTTILWVRSIAICVATMWMCCNEPGLFSRGTGYLAPQMVEIVVWIDIVSSLLLPISLVK
jgi:pimeloyl-ACP methyl ester carboxylesterase